MFYKAYVDFLPDGRVVIYDNFLTAADQNHRIDDENFKVVNYDHTFIIHIPKSSVRIFVGEFNREQLIEYLISLGISKDLITVFDPKTLKIAIL